MAAKSTSTSPVNTDAAKLAEVAEKTRIRDILKSDLAQIASEKSRCEKTKKNWTVATVVGGVGVVATGTAAIIQGNKIDGKNKKLKELNKKK
jgi:hypothetical protein